MFPSNSRAYGDPETSHNQRRTNPSSFSSMDESGTNRSPYHLRSDLFNTRSTVGELTNLPVLQNDAIAANALIRSMVREQAITSAAMNLDAERILAMDILSREISRPIHLSPSFGDPSNLCALPSLPASLPTAGLPPDATVLLQQALDLEQRRRLSALYSRIPLATAGLQTTSRLPLLSSHESVEAEQQRKAIEQALLSRNLLGPLAPVSVAQLGFSLHAALRPVPAFLDHQANRTSAVNLPRNPPSLGSPGVITATTLASNSSSTLGSLGAATSQAAVSSEQSYRPDEYSDGNKKLAAKSNSQKARQVEARTKGESPERRKFPSERASLEISSDCAPEAVSHVLKILGSTLRCKADPYIDVNALPEPHKIAEKRVFRGTDVFFPDVLYQMLEDAEREGWDDVIHWMPHGRSIRVPLKDRFVSEILPRYFKDQTKWSSFSRQLRLYGFARVSKGVDLDSYYHELFLKGRGELVRYMRRVGAPHGLDRRTFKLAEGDDPDFYALPSLRISSVQQTSMNDDKMKSSANVETADDELKKRSDSFGQDEQSPQRSERAKERSSS